MFSKELFLLIHIKFVCQHIRLSTNAGFIDRSILLLFQIISIVGFSFYLENKILKTNRSFHARLEMMCCVLRFARIMNGS